jgi:hypothetical protein
VQQRQPLQTLVSDLDRGSAAALERPACPKAAKSPWSDAPAAYGAQKVACSPSSKGHGTWSMGLAAAVRQRTSAQSKRTAGLGRQGHYESATKAQRQKSHTDTQTSQMLVLQGVCRSACRGPPNLTGQRAALGVVSCPGRWPAGSQGNRSAGLRSQDPTLGCRGGMVKGACWKPQAKVATPPNAGCHYS